MKKMTGNFHSLARTDLKAIKGGGIAKAAEFCNGLRCTPGNEQHCIRRGCSCIGTSCRFV
ncbi:hypothetical protein KTO58_14440 [Chitinophaga pendula]|uniref:hypothetical protein n=1 Tax=Chitinophaga TaxID=79328 RepID=UPI0012FDE26D|nr:MULTISPECIES: hypothetical protein [Chitinophaga]UCJ04901.1 hypothetical protein KTO58_14440 [Chitinophaga pendula]